MNQYLTKIWNLSLKNQQADDYISLCQSSLDRTKIDGYVEKHHMFPKCLCVTNEEKLDKKNLVVFTAKEHFIAHRLLSEMFEGNIKRKMQKALSMMLVDRLGNRIITVEEYEIARKANSESKIGIKLPVRTKEHSKNLSNALSGRTRTEESCRKQSNTKKNTPLSETQIKEYERRIGKYDGPMKNKTHREESKIKMSISSLGKSKSDNHKKNISIGLTGRQFSEEHIRNLSGPKSTIECPHCGKIGGVNNMPRWHFNNCKKVRYA